MKITIHYVDSRNRPGVHSSGCPNRSQVRDTIRTMLSWLDDTDTITSITVY